MDYPKEMSTDTSPSDNLEIAGNGTSLTIRRLDAQIDSQFVEFYSAYLGNRSPDWDALRQAADAFFSRNPSDAGLHDKFFANFTILFDKCLELHQFNDALLVWDMPLAAALEWEGYNPGRFVHKGTPYYWLGVASILKGNLDAGYAYMHRALKEDKRTTPNGYRTLPPFALLTLDYPNNRQAFYGWVMHNVQFLERHLEAYRDTRLKALQLRVFHNNFLRNPPSTETLFRFSYALARLINLDEIHYDVLPDPFVGQLQMRLLFDLATVIDEAIRTKNPKAGAGKSNFVMQAGYLSKLAGLGLGQEDYAKIEKKASGVSFDTTVTTLLDESYRLHDGRTPLPLARDIAVTYIIRNWAAHHIAAPSVVSNRFPEVRQCLFDTLFLAAEELY